MGGYLKKTDWGDLWIPESPDETQIVKKALEAVAALGLCFPEEQVSTHARHFKSSGAHPAAPPPNDRPANEP